MTQGEEEMRAGKERETKGKQTKGERRWKLGAGVYIMSTERNRKGNAQHSVFVERNELADVILLV